MPSLALILIVLDGWGLAVDYPGNALTRARIPAMDFLFRIRPQAQRKCGGDVVDLSGGYPDSGGDDRGVSSGMI